MAGLLHTDIQRNGPQRWPAVVLYAPQVVIECSHGVFEGLVSDATTILIISYRVHRKLFRGPSTLLVLLYTQTEPCVELLDEK